MLGERGSDLLLGKSPLAAARVPEAVAA